MVRGNQHNDQGVVMKVMICGKGGSGKSTVTVLLARALKEMGKTVLVVDADESNLCLHRLLGASLPEVVMEAMGGRSGVKQQLQPTYPAEEALLAESLTIDSLPASCLAEVDGIRLLVVGKIRTYGEGCACLVGSISKTILSRLRETDDEVVLLDAEAGLEHFGRRIDALCDLVLAVIDPSHESIAMAGRITHLAAEAGVETFYILNKVEPALRDAMSATLEARRIVATVPRSEVIFADSLHGRKLGGGGETLGELCRLLHEYRRPIPATAATSAGVVVGMPKRSAIP
jgi:CO dehydrogenase maturation factor